MTPHVFIVTLVCVLLPKQGGGEKFLSTRKWSASCVILVQSILEKNSLLMLWKDKNNSDWKEESGDRRRQRAIVWEKEMKNEGEKKREGWFKVLEAERSLQWCLWFLWQREDILFLMSHSLYSLPLGLSLSPSLSFSCIYTSIWSCVFSSVTPFFFFWHSFH